MRFVLLLVALVLFIASGAGLGALHFGSITLSLLALGLAAWVLAELIGATPRG